MPVVLDSDGFGWQGYDIYFENVDCTGHANRIETGTIFQTYPTGQTVKYSDYAVLPDGTVARVDESTTVSRFLVQSRKAGGANDACESLSGLGAPADLDRFEAVGSIPDHTPALSVTVQ